MTHKLKTDTLLGEGGMAQVYLAEDPALGRAVAVKVLRAELCDQDDVVQRFVGEAKLAAALDHPGILPIYALGVDDQGRPAVSMKLSQGGSLHDRMQGDRRLPQGDVIDELVDVVVKVCEALGQAHDHGVVHGDIKTRNILLGRHGVVYVADWGNACAMGAEAPLGPDGRPTILGTPAVLSPEQAAGGPVDARTDVFGVGAMLYTLLARRVPYGRGGPQARIDAARVGQRKPLNTVARRTPGVLCAIVERAMALHPTDRHPTIDALRDDLVAYRRRQVDAPLRLLSDGEVLVRQGDPSDALYIVEGGRLRVSATHDGVERALGECAAGDVIGEIGLLADDVRTATVTAEGRVSVRVVRRDAVQDELARLSPWLQTVFTVLARRLHAKVQVDPVIPR